MKHYNMYAKAEKAQGTVLQRAGFVPISGERLSAFLCAKHITGVAESTAAVAEVTCCTTAIYQVTQCCIYGICAYNNKVHMGTWLATRKPLEVLAFSFAIGHAAVP